ncbi:uncharacterized protein LOC132397669 [Hypanus sabinus]|uniref:uncharacterized protein LOC132397669 n=1 Tax=Hypanus sabinus TaxID=79690 RepID=UPI0028C3F075|nr:uncharacterized protein LOC132397669 [Hypanus sabinus]
MVQTITANVTGPNITLTWMVNPLPGMVILNYRIIANCTDHTGGVQQIHSSQPANMTTLVLTGLGSLSVCTSVIQVNTSSDGPVTSRPFTFDIYSEVDECLQDNGGCSQLCVNTVGSYHCDCHPGYTLRPGNSSTCTDVDECLQDNGGCSQLCVNTVGSYHCDCHPGYTLRPGNRTSCTDVDECQSGSHNCHSSASCSNSPGSFQCVCGAGYTGDGRNCTDVDECQSGSHDCHSSASCSNSPGSFQCVCGAGYTGDGRTCTDVDECQQDNGGCSQLCVNTVGSYHCDCHPGYTLRPGNRTSCTDVNECADPAQNQCDSNAQCLNSMGSYHCECKSYYRGNGTHCEDCFCPPEIIPGSVDLQTLSRNPCPCVSGFIVSNNFQSYYQHSADMYWFFNLVQVSNSTHLYTGIRFRVDLLTVTSQKDYISFSCGMNPDQGVQFNLTEEDVDIGTFRVFNCTNVWVHFHSGPHTPSTNFNIYYEMEWYPCRRVDCDVTASCGSDRSGYPVCICVPGWSESETGCYDIRNMVQTVGANVRGPNITLTWGVNPIPGIVILDYQININCTNHTGGVQQIQSSQPANMTTLILTGLGSLSMCTTIIQVNTSSDGLVTSRPFTFNIHSDVDECLQDNGGCSQLCVNTVGSYHCDCHPGYTLRPGNRTTCTDVDECLRDNGGCSQLCVNTVGSYHCDCHPGYTLRPGNRSMCTDVNECVDPALNQCDSNAQCLNSMGSYHCECKSYYRGNGTHCEGCFCPPEMIPGSVDLQALSRNVCPCVSGFILSNNFHRYYQHRADMYWFFNLVQVSNSTHLYTGIRFRVDLLTVTSQEDHISFGCGMNPDQDVRFSLTEEDLNIGTFHVSNCTNMWVHFHSGPHTPSTKFNIYYEMEWYPCRRVDCDVTASCGSDRSGYPVCICVPGWRESETGCYDIRNMVQTVTANVTGPNITLTWMVNPLPGIVILNYRINANCTNHTGGVQQIQSSRPADATTLVLTGLGSLSVCTTIIQVNTSSDVLVTSRPFTFNVHSACFCPPEIIPGTVDLQTLSRNPCPCTSGFIVSSHFHRYQHSADMYWFFNLVQVSNSTHLYTGIRFRVDLLIVTSQEDHISFGCRMNPDQDVRFSLTEEDVDISTFHVSNCTNVWVHFHSGPQTPSTKFNIYYEMDWTPCRRLDCNVTASCGSDKSGYPVCICVPGWSESETGCYDIRNMVQTVTANVTGPNITLTWMVNPLPGMVILNYQIITNCTNQTGGVQQIQSSRPADTSTLVLTGLGSLSMCTTIVQINTSSDGLVTSRPFTFNIHSDVDECLQDNGGCSQLCVNTVGSYHCDCHPGYTLRPGNRTSCTDVNECADPALNQCDSNAQCLNSMGSYHCECKSYYRGNGTHCEGCFCPPEIIPGTVDLQALSKNPCPCVSGFIVSNNFPSYYQNSADMYWFFNLVQVSNSTHLYTGIRFRVDLLTVTSQEDHISFGCGMNPDQDVQFTLTKEDVDIGTFRISNCTNMWVHFHSGPQTPSTKFNIYYEMEWYPCRRVDCDVTASCGSDRSGYLVCICVPGWSESETGCYDIRNMVQTVTANVTGPNITLTWMVKPLPRMVILNYRIIANCTNRAGGVQQIQSSQPVGTTTLVFAGLGSLSMCTTVIQVNTSSDGLVTSQPFTFNIHSDVDECLQDNGGCSQLCVNTVGSYHCDCHPGYILRPGNRSTCTDVNECADPALNQCDSNAQCLNLMGSYHCECKSYYRGNGTHCEGCFCPPEIIPGTVDLQALSRNPCPCVSGFIVSNNFQSYYQNSADMYWFFNLVQVSNSTHLYTGVRFRVDLLTVTSQEDHISFGCGMNPDQDVRFTLTQEDVDIDTFRVSNCTNMWVHFHSGPQTPSTKFNIYYEMEWYPCRRVDCDVTAMCGLDRSGYPVCICVPGWSESETGCYDIRNMVQTVTANVTGSNITLTWMVNPFPGMVILNYRIIANCTNHTGGIQQIQSSQPADATTLVLTGLGSLSTCTTIIQINTSSDGLVTSRPFTFNIHSDVDECLQDNGGCSQLCVNTVGSYHCDCHPGYTLRPGNRSRCTDVNECADPALNQCDSNAQCLNSMGSYHCECKSYYRGNGTHCEGCFCPPEIIPGTVDLQALSRNPCPCVSGFIVSNNFHRYYQNSADMYWFFNLVQVSNSTHLYTGIRFRVDLLTVMFQEDRISFGCGLNPDENMRFTLTQEDVDIGTFRVSNCTNMWVHFHSGPQTPSTKFNIYFEMEWYPCRRVDCDGTASCGSDRSGYPVCICVPGWRESETGCYDIRNMVQTVSANVTGSKITLMWMVNPLPGMVILNYQINANCTNHTGGVQQIQSSWPADTPTLVLTGLGSLSVCTTIIQVNTSSDGLVTSRPFTFDIHSDVDECLQDNGGCSQLCVNTVGSYHCDCHPGYTLRPGNRTTCTDVDECLRDNGGCSQLCVNTVGSYRCDCHPGYTLRPGNRSMCTDVDECQSGSHDCHSSASCSNSPGSFQCVCGAGYTGDGRTCTDVDECLWDNGSCSQLCVNMVGSYHCDCHPGYTLRPGSRMTCTDVDECQTGSHNCHSSASCSNSPGSFQCVCGAGYTGDGRTCTDVDECLWDNGSCSQLCVNMVGSYHCDCHPGYTLRPGSRMTCTDVDECQTGSHNCHSSASCSNSPGSFQCVCGAGYTGDGRTCTDVDECLWDNGSCSQLCVNMVGSYHCDCHPGYTLRPGSRMTCTDVDECQTGSHNCHSSASCSNSPGSFQCVCGAGYTGDGRTCTDVDECLQDNGGCSQRCANSVGSYLCGCHPGYMPILGSRTSCTDVNECADPVLNQCDSNAQCLNSMGSYHCECKSYYRGNGTHCEGCFCPPEIIPGTVDLQTLSRNPCPCVSGFIVSNNFQSYYQHSADMYWFFNLVQVSNSTHLYTGIRFRVDLLTVTSQEDHISFGCGMNPDQDMRITFTEKHLDIRTFSVSNCTSMWVHFHSGPHTPSTKFNIYYEMEWYPCRRVDCDVTATCGSDRSGYPVCICVPGWSELETGCYDIRNMVQTVTTNIIGPNITLMWMVNPLPGMVILNYRIIANCTNQTGGVQQFQSSQPADTTTLVLTGLGSLYMCTTVIQVNTSSDGLVTSRPFTFDIRSEMILEPLRLISISATDAVISWGSRRSVSSLRACRLNYYNTGAPHMIHTINASSVSTETLITGLEPNTAYTTFMECDFPLNQTITSQPLEITTPSYWQFLSNLSVSHVTASVAVISWDPPKSQTVLVVSYHINYGPYGSNRLMKTVVTVPPITRVILTDLNESTLYVVSASAKTFFGDKDSGLLLKFMTQSFIQPVKIPSAPQEVKVGEFEQCCVLVSWKPPSAPKEKIIQYNVDVQVNESSSVQYTTTVNYIYLQDLDPNQIYIISVSAVNSQGVRSASEKLSVRMIQHPEATAKIKPRLLISEDFSVRVSSIFLRLPECGVFDAAAKQLNATYGRLSIYIVVATEKVASENFTLLSLDTLPGLYYYYTGTEGQHPYIAQQHFSVYDCSDREHQQREKTVSYYMIGSNVMCNSIEIICDRLLQSNTSYRIKYILADQHKGEIMSSDWSDTFRTKTATTPHQVLEDNWQRSAGMIVITVISLFLLCFLLLCLLLMCCYRKKRTGIMWNTWIGYDTHFKRNIRTDNVFSAAGGMQEDRKVNNTLFVLQPQHQRYNEDNIPQSWQFPQYYSGYEQKTPPINQGINSNHLSLNCVSPTSDKGMMIQDSVYGDKESRRQGMGSNHLSYSTLSNSTSYDGLAFQKRDFDQKQLVQTGFTGHRWIWNGKVPTRSIQTGSFRSGSESNRLIQTGSVQSGSTQSRSVLDRSTQTLQLWNGSIKTESNQTEMAKMGWAETGSVYTESIQHGLAPTGLREHTVAPMATRLPLGVRMVQSRSVQTEMEEGGSLGMGSVLSTKRYPLNARMVQSLSAQTEMEKGGSVLSSNRFSDTSSLVESVRIRSSTQFIKSNREIHLVSTSSPTSGSIDNQ